MKRAVVLLAVNAAVILSSCAGSAPFPVPSAPQPPAPVSAPTPTAAPVQVFRESGTAAWYGSDMHGRKAADGSTFDREGLSAAHRILPLGTVIRVTNLDNYRTIDVRVSDRGPFVRGRVLELSYGAAKALEFVREGTARVKVESLAPVRADGVFTVQAASFVEEEHAKSLKARLQTKYETVYIVPGETNLGTFFRVRVGLYPSEEKAERIAAKLTLDGLEPVVVRKD
jgi:rare lipoprotein A